MQICNRQANFSTTYRHQANRGKQTSENKRVTDPHTSWAPSSSRPNWVSVNGSPESGGQSLQAKCLYQRFNHFSLDLKLTFQGSTSNQSTLNTTEKLKEKNLYTRKTLSAHLSSKTEGGGGRTTEKREKTMDNWRGRAVHNQ